MSKWTALLAQGRDVTLAAVGYLVPLNGAERLEPMQLPHSTSAPRPPSGQGFRQAVRAVGSARGTLQLNAGGRGVVARILANQLRSTSFRELRSDQVARRRAATGRAPAKSIKRRVWLFAGDQSAAGPLGPGGIGSGGAGSAPTSMADALGIKPCQGC